MANPLAKLWSEVVEQGLDQDPKALIPIAEVLDMIQRALVLLGSANNTISETRREIALGAAHSSFRKYAKGDFSEMGGDLFGVAFNELLVQKVETDSALAKAVSIANKSSGPKVFHRDLNAAERPNPAGFFQGAGSVDTGTGPARPALRTEAHGKGSTPKVELLQRKQVCSADWAPVKQSTTNLQANSRISRGPLQGAKASRPAAVLSAGMDQTNPRPLGIRDNQWLQDPFLKPTTKYRDSSFLIFKRGTRSNLTGDLFSLRQRSDQGSKTRSGFCEQHLPCSKKWTEVETYLEPEGTKFIYSQRTLQNGGHKVRPGPVVQRGFHVQARSERRLPVNSHTSKSSEVPQLQLEGQPLPIHSSTVRASHSPTCFHESHEAYFGKSSLKRSENGGISGRFVDHWQMQGRDKTSLPVDKETTGIPRLCCEYGEVPLQSNPENRISGVHHRFRDNDLRAPQSEDEGNQARMQKALAGTTGDSTADYTHNRGLGCNSHCNHSSSTALSCSPMAQKQKSLPPPLI